MVEGIDAPPGDEGIDGIEEGMEGIDGMDDGIDAPPPPPPELPEGMLELLPPPELPPPDGVLELLPPLEPDEPLEPPDEPALPPDEGGVDEGIVGEDICWPAQPPIRKLETAPIAAISLATTSSRLIEWLLFIVTLLLIPDSDGEMARWEPRQCSPSRSCDR